MLDEFEVSRSKVMLAILFQIVTGLFRPVLGRYMDQFAMRLFVLSGALAMSLGLFLLSLANEFWQIVALHVTLLPVGMILTGTLASQTMVSKWFTEKRGLAIGVSSMGTSLGGLTKAASTAWLIGEQGWQGAYLVLDAVADTSAAQLSRAATRSADPAPAGFRDLRC